MLTIIIHKCMYVPYNIHFILNKNGTIIANFTFIMVGCMCVIYVSYIYTMYMNYKFKARTYSKFYLKLGLLILFTLLQVICPFLCKLLSLKQLDNFFCCCWTIFNSCAKFFLQLIYRYVKKKKIAIIIYSTSNMLILLVLDTNKF